MINIRLCNGKVPVYVGGDSPYKLVDFPPKEVFNEIMKPSNQSLKDKYWGILQMRASGHSLTEVAVMYGLSKERIRQIEARFLARLASSLMLETP
jgi:DNA-directed RNA polymerase sigma subunit (sigma70/sigma32)